MNIVIGQILIGIGLVFIAIGTYSLLRLGDFYTRILITSKVDSMGLITIIFGAMIISGWTFFSAKLAFILLFEMITAPVGTHAVARSAYRSGYQIINHTRLFTKRQDNNIDSEGHIARTVEDFGDLT
ncbi:MAG: monovalent cation/H(+) antiporter subunit G [Spirochaeta sp.]|nr:monovalent cation/H(+) antiporter subunit G [Spirochaeta sp.]